MCQTRHLPHFESASRWKIALLFQVVLLFESGRDPRSIPFSVARRSRNERVGLPTHCALFTTAKPLWSGARTQGQTHEPLPPAEKPQRQREAQDAPDREHKKRSAECLEARAVVHNGAQSIVEGRQW